MCNGWSSADHSTYLSCLILLCCAESCGVDRGKAGRSVDSLRVLGDVR